MTLIICKLCLNGILNGYNFPNSLYFILFTITYTKEVYTIKGVAFGKQGCG